MIVKSKMQLLSAVVKTYKKGNEDKSFKEVILLAGSDVLKMGVGQDVKIEDLEKRKMQVIDVDLDLTASYDGKSTQVKLVAFK